MHTLHLIIFKKYLPLILSVLVINLSLSTLVFAGEKEERAVEFAEKVKVNIAKLGTGENAKIEVKLKDGTKIKGYVGQINETGFIVVDEKTKAATEIPYPNARQVKGHNSKDGVKVAIGIGVLAAVIIFFLIVINSRDF